MQKFHPKTIYNRIMRNLRYMDIRHNKFNSLFIGILTILISLSLAPQVQASTTDKVYVSRNEQGVVIYSDHPIKGAKELVINKSNTSTVPVKTATLKTAQNAISEKYQVEIIQPIDNATVRDNTGSVHVSVRVSPLLNPGLSMQLYLDNVPYEKPQIHSTFKLINLDRGEHQVKVHLLNVKGKVIASSGIITVYMHRASLKRAN